MTARETLPWSRAAVEYDHVSDVRNAFLSKSGRRPEFLRQKVFHFARRRRRPSEYTSHGVR